MKRQITVLTGLLLALIAPVSLAIEPSSLPQINTQHFKTPINKHVAKPQLQLKGQLKIISYGMSGEFCTEGCEPFVSDFKVKKLKCGFFHRS